MSGTMPGRRDLIAGVAVAAVGSAAGFPARAQSVPVPSQVAVATDRPQIEMFDGRTGIDFPADPSLNLSRVATIEFWVRPMWTALSYSPTVMAAIGDTAARYGIVMAANKQAIGFVSGDDLDYAVFNFDDGKTHHVAFIVQGERTDVIIDGESNGAINQPIGDVDVTSFHIGSLRGNALPFIGTLAEIRLWDTALDPDDVAAFRLMHIFSKDGLKHPDIASLVGVSDFANGARGFTLTHNPASAGASNLSLPTPFDSLTPDERAILREPVGDDAAPGKP